MSSFSDVGRGRDVQHLKVQASPKLAAHGMKASAVTALPLVLSQQDSGKKEVGDPRSYRTLSNFSLGKQGGQTDHFVPYREYLKTKEEIAAEWKDSPFLSEKVIQFRKELEKQVPLPHDRLEIVDRATYFSRHQELRNIPKQVLFDLSRETWLAPMYGVSTQQAQRTRSAQLEILRQMTKDKFRDNDASIHADTVQSSTRVGSHDDRRSPSTDDSLASMQESLDRSQELPARKPSVAYFEPEDDHRDITKITKEALTSASPQSQSVDALGVGIGLFNPMKEIPRSAIVKDSNGISRIRLTPSHPSLYGDKLATIEGTNHQLWKKRQEVLDQSAERTARTKAASQKRSALGIFRWCSVPTTNSIIDQFPMY